jgi:monofunctional biosynthetic peptidoglycan transglycosylase
VASPSPTRAGRRRPVRRAFGLVGRLVRGVVLLVVGYLVLCALLLVGYRFVQPPATIVQAQRSIERLFDGDSPAFTYAPVEADEMDPDIRRAVVASEDARFYQHNGFDFVELRRAREDAVRRGRPMRGASTITQQLVKNLFLTTHRSVVRKGLEIPLTLVAELVLPKERILTLYLNVAEWGPGVFGIEAAARHHYGRSASSLSRTQASRLAAVLPNPLERDPDQMGGTASRVRTRMGQMGW